MNTSLIIFLLIGQSNMSGRGPMDAVHPLQHAHVQMFRQGEWTKAKEPLHTDQPAAAGIGLGMSFAVEIARQNPSFTVGLVPCAVGSSLLDSWMPGSPNYVAAVATTREAMKSGKLGGILWHQGEQDALSATDSATYAARLAVMVETLRKDLNAPNVPFIAGELGAFLKDHPGCKDNFGTVNEQLRSLLGQVPGYRLVTVDGLIDKGDHTHFSSPALRELGKRYAKEFSKKEP